LLIEKVSTESATSSTTYTYSDAIDLNSKKYSNLPIYLKVDIGGSTTSGMLYLTYSISEKFAGTYANVKTGSGTSLILSGGTSVGSSGTSTGAVGDGSNGSFYIPLTIVPHSGCTKWLNTVPFMKVGSLGYKQAVDVSMYVCIG
jgi:hypothetical protein